MSDRTISPVTAKLLKARERLSDESKWCRRALFKLSKDKVQQSCIRGALLENWQPGIMFTDNSKEPVVNEADSFLAKAARELFPDFMPMYSSLDIHVAVNNELGYEAVMKVLNHAISMSMEGK